MGMNKLQYQCQANGI